MNRMVFAGTPGIAAECLSSLISASTAAEWEIVGVLTRPDAPVGRKRTLTASPVAQVAEQAEIPVIKTARLDDGVIDQLKRWAPDLGVVVAYGALLPQAALDVPQRGWVNLHYSALPKYRGAAPVQHAMLDGQTSTAATIFQLERGMDTGPIHGSAEYRIPELTSAGAALQDLTALGTQLLLDMLPGLLDGSSQPQPQSGEPSLAPKLSGQDAFIDPVQPAAELVARINATIPEPGAWTLNDQARMKLGVARLYERPVQGQAGEVLQVESDRNPGEKAVVLVAGDGQAVLLTQVQPAGKQMINAADWLRGQQQPVRLGGHAQ